jgi:hypothetical protein
MADIRRQLRSSTAVLGGVGLLAALLTACSSGAAKRCVDRDSFLPGKGYHIVSSKSCTSGKSSLHTVWYYGGVVKDGFVESGSFTTGGKRSGSSHSGVHRGGVHRGGHGKTRR